MRRAHSSEISFLKFFVYLMGFALIVGAIIITTAVYKKIDMEASYLANKKHCANANIEVTGRILEISVNDPQKIKIYLRNEDGENVIAIYDECTGALMQSVKVIDTAKPVKKTDTSALESNFTLVN